MIYFWSFSRRRNIAFKKAGFPVQEEMAQQAEA